MTQVSRSSIKLKFSGVVAYNKSSPVVLSKYIFLSTLGIAPSYWFINYWCLPLFPGVFFSGVFRSVMSTNSQLAVPDLYRQKNFPVCSSKAPCKPRALRMGSFIFYSSQKYHWGISFISCNHNQKKRSIQVETESMQSDCFSIFIFLEITRYTSSITTIMWKVVLNKNITCYNKFLKKKKSALSAGSISYAIASFYFWLLISGSAITDAPFSCSVNHAY